MKPAIKVSKIPDFPVRVLLKDKVIGSYDQNLEQWKYQDSAEIAVDALPEIGEVKAQGLHPDEWKEGVAKIVRASSGPTIHVVFDKPKEWKIRIGPQVDNRGGPEREIFVGAMPQKIEANGKRSLYYPAPSAAEHAVVHIGGNNVGTLWAMGEAEPDWEKIKFFIDASGKRSYRYTQVYYSSQGFSAQGVELLKLKPIRGELSAGYVHRVPFNFSFFLERAPEKIDVKANPLSEIQVRTELVDR